MPGHDTGAALTLSGLSAMAAAGPAINIGNPVAVGNADVI
jgi:hypothetical protein